MALADLGDLNLARNSLTHRLINKETSCAMPCSKFLIHTLEISDKVLDWQTLRRDGINYRDRP